MADDQDKLEICPRCGAKLENLHCTYCVTQYRVEIYEEGPPQLVEEGNPSSSARPLACTCIGSST